MYQRLTFLLLCAALLLGVVATGCGGGDSVASNGVGSGGTGSYTNGPVTGLGSIIVGGVRYEVTDGTTTVVRDDGSTTATGTSELLLGMVVEVSGSTITAATDGGDDTATATLVRYDSTVVGPVSLLNTSTGQLVVLGQTITFDARTVMPTSLAVNQVVSIHALVKPASALQATRIDVLSAVPSDYKVTGQVTSVNASAGTFVMGQGGSVSVALGAGVAWPSGLRVGAIAKVWLDTTSSGGSWVASSVSVLQSWRSSSTQARMEGVALNLSGSTFVVNGVTVDFSRATVSGATLVEGERVRVKGALTGGVLVASVVKVDTDTDVQNEKIELHGTVSAKDGSAQTMVVRGVTVDYSGASFSGGLTAATLANGQCVEAQGTSYNASRQLVATTVKQESSCRN